MRPRHPSGGLARAIRGFLWMNRGWLAASAHRAAPPVGSGIRPAPRAGRANRDNVHTAGYSGSGNPIATSGTPTMRTPHRLLKFLARAALPAIAGCSPDEFLAPVLPVVAEEVWAH